VKFDKIGRGKCIFEFDTSQQGLSFGLHISHNSLALVCRDTTGQTLQLWGVLSDRMGTARVDSSHVLGMLWVYQKSPANVMIWVKGKMVQNAKIIMARNDNFDYVQWQPSGTARTPSVLRTGNVVPWYIYLIRCAMSADVESAVLMSSIGDAVWGNHAYNYKTTQTTHGILSCHARLPIWLPNTPRSTNGGTEGSLGTTTGNERKRHLDKNRS